MSDNYIKIFCSSADEAVETYHRFLASRDVGDYSDCGCYSIGHGFVIWAIPAPEIA